MDDDDQVTTGASVLPITISVFALVLGCAALYFSVMSAQQLSALRDNTSNYDDMVKKLEVSQNRFNEQLLGLEAQQRKLGVVTQRFRAFSSESERSLRETIAGVQSNREEIIAIAQRLNAGQPTVNRLPSQQPPETAIVEVVPVIQTEAVQSGVIDRTYTIQSGDTLAQVAAREKISLQSLLDANTDVDPRRLRVGQLIVLPANP